MSASAMIRQSTYDNFPGHNQFTHSIQHLLQNYRKERKLHRDIFVGF